MTLCRYCTYWHDPQEIIDVNTRICRKGKQTTHKDSCFYFHHRRQYVCPKDGQTKNWVECVSGTDPHFGPKPFCENCPLFFPSDESPKKEKPKLIRKDKPKLIRNQQSSLW